MSHNISEFLSAIAAGNSLMRPNQFEFTLDGPPNWALSDPFAQDLRFYCNQAELPGANIDSTDNRPYGFGNLEYFPTGVSFMDLNTSFYADANGQLIKFFHAWIRNIVNFDESHGPGDRFRIHYREDYISQVGVTQFNEHGERVLRFKYVDAFPVHLQPIGTRWFSRDEVTEFRLIWKYRTYQELSIEADGWYDNFGFQPMPGTGLPGIADRVNGGLNRIIGSVNRVQDAVGQVQYQAYKYKSAAQNVPALLRSKLGNGGFSL